MLRRAHVQQNEGAKVQRVALYLGTVDKYRSQTKALSPWRYWVTPKTQLSGLSNVGRSKPREQVLLLEWLFVSAMLPHRESAHLSNFPNRAATFSLTTPSTQQRAASTTSINRPEQDVHTSSSIHPRTCHSRIGSVSSETQSRQTRSSTRS